MCLDTLILKYIKEYIYIYIYIYENDTTYPWKTNDCL